GSTIANNESNGILLLAGTGNTINENSIYGNGNKNININGTSGPLPNDSPDVPMGPNNQQNYPDIASVVQAGGTTTVAFQLVSAPSTSYRLEFFANPAPGTPAGRTYLDNPILSTDASGNLSTSKTFSGLYD